MKMLNLSLNELKLIAKDKYKKNLDSSKSTKNEDYDADKAFKKTSKQNH